MVASGAAAAGLAGGLAILNRRRAADRGLFEKLRDAVGIDGSLDLEGIAAAARRLSSLGEQVDDVLTALQKAGGGKKR